MPEAKPSLQLEFQELLLVGLGAVPGALLRWQVALYLGDQNLLVNVFGAALLGLLAGFPAAPRRQLLLGIGFCGSLTTLNQMDPAGDVEWNFEKFLVGKDGTVIARFKSSVTPEDLKTAIEAALAA